MNFSSLALCATQKACPVGGVRDDVVQDDYFHQRRRRARADAEAGFSATGAFNALALKI